MPPVGSPPPEPAAEEKTAGAKFRSFSLESFIAILSILGICWYLFARFVFHLPAGASEWPLLAVILVGGAPLIVNLLRGILRGRFGSDLLAGISIVTSVILHEYLAGSVIVLMLSGGTALEQYATRRASSVLAALAKRMPRVAHRKTGAEVSDIGLDDLRVGDLVIVFPHETCPVDGSVTEGTGSMDESYLTGEPFNISKTVGSEVLSGAVNGEAALTVKVGRLPEDSRYARIIRVMREAEMNRPQLRRIADRLGIWYTVLAVSIAVIGWTVSGNPTRFLAVVVIATPCPLLLAIPVAIIGAISVAASRGIIIKNPAMLERIDSCRTAIFDKTGTLTYGRPALTETLCAPGVDRDWAIQAAASLEQYSRHPLAPAILQAARQEAIGFIPVEEISEKPGAGLSGRIGDRNIQITGRKKIIGKAPGIEAVLPPVAPGMECILLVDGEYAATFRFRDAPRDESRSFITHLAPKHGVKRLMLLSGDRESEVRYLAGAVGIQEAHFSKSPEEKLAMVREESGRTPTLFIGDGINDAPAMQAATVSIAFGQNSDVAAEAADAVVLEPSLRKVDELIHIGRRMKRIAFQSAIGGMAISMAGMIVAAAGYLPPVAGAVAQEFIDVVAVLNAIRVALPSHELDVDRA